MIDGQYADELRKFVTWVPAYGIKPAFIAVGPTGGDWRWTRSFFSRMTECSERKLDMVYGWALHYSAAAIEKGTLSISHGTNSTSF
ncbi:MAG TPA: hypothetical protein VIX17_02040 [Pyrinomonadaceae bacterium]|jgi:hypothetical protein